MGTVAQSDSSSTVALKHSTMAWTWTGYRYDPVFRFKDKDFFQPGLNQAEARFWRLKIHKEIDKRGTRSSIKLSDEDDDENPSAEPTMEMIVEEIDGDDNLDEELGRQTYQILVEKSDVIPEQNNPYSKQTTGNSGTLNQYNTTDKQYSKDTQYKARQYITGTEHIDRQYRNTSVSSDRQYRNTSVSSQESTRSSSSEATFKDYQFRYGRYDSHGHREHGGYDGHGQGEHGGYDGHGQGENVGFDGHGVPSGYDGHVEYGEYEDRKFPGHAKTAIIKNDKTGSQEAEYFSSKFY